MSLNSYRKDELSELAETLGVEILPTDKVVTIIKKIENFEDFDKEIAIAQIKLIREDREKDKERQYALAEKDKERQHELEKLKLSQLNETVSIGSDREEHKKAISLKNFVQNFNPENSEISLYLNLFERQAEKAEVPADQWVTQLLPLLPINLTEVILREPKELADDYQHIKNVLLDRFRINAESFRLKFMQNQRTPGSQWKDLNYELNAYLEGWLSGLEIKDFESLKKLMVADQLKKRTSPEIRDHFIDTWADIVDPDVLAEKLDNYEAVRKSTRKNVNIKPADDRKNDRTKFNDESRELKIPERKVFNWRDNYTREEKERAYEKKRSPVFRCFNCNSPNHRRSSCPLLNDEKEISHVNYLGDFRHVTPEQRLYETDRVNTLEKVQVNHVRDKSDLGPLFKPYMFTALVNNVETEILRDSGSVLDVVPQRLINTQMLSGTEVLVKQPFDSNYLRLKVANINLEIDNVGTIQTKAIVADKTTNLNHYLLGNKTMEMIDRKMSTPTLVNVPQTQSRILKCNFVCADNKEKNEKTSETELLCSTGTVPKIKGESPRNTDQRVNPSPGTGDLKSCDEKKTDSSSVGKKSIVGFPKPKTKSEIQYFLKIVNANIPFGKDRDKFVSSLRIISHSKPRKGKVKWDEPGDLAFRMLKMMLRDGIKSE